MWFFFLKYRCERERVEVKKKRKMKSVEEDSDKNIQAVIVSGKLMDDKWLLRDASL